MSKYEFLLKHGKYADEFAEIIGEEYRTFLQDLLYLGYTEGKLEVTRESINQQKDAA